MGLDSIFGGGNILGAAFNIASAMFPALQLASSLFNALTKAIGSAITQAVGQLAQEAGLPKFIADAVKGLVEQILGGKQPTEPAADQAVQQQLGDQLKSFVEGLVKQIVQDAKEAKEEADSAAGSAGGKGGWLVALAKAFGKIADKAAKELEQMGKKLNQENPSEMIEYQARSQEFAQMMNTFTNAIKTIGEANANTVRKG
jgi:hypothetical protein